MQSHPSWVRGLKPQPKQDGVAKTRKSHPSWVRGLKHDATIAYTDSIKSHPSWVRGLKHQNQLPNPKTHQCRTPRGCVD